MREITTCLQLLLVFSLSAIAFVDFFDVSLIDVKIPLVEEPTMREKKEDDDPDFGAFWLEQQFCFDRMNFLGRTLFSQNVKVRAKQEELGRYVWDDFELDKKLGVTQMRPAQTYEDMGKYEGDWSVEEELWHGRGVLVEPDGSIFEGYFDYGERKGKGRSILSNGDVYIGDYLSDLRSGYGVYSFSDGSEYRGDWLNGVMEGYGVFSKKDRSIYSGHWKANKKHGSGI